jgi:hypothetical protein
MGWKHSGRGSGFGHPVWKKRGGGRSRNGSVNKEREKEIKIKKIK